MRAHHFFHNINQAVAGCLCARKRAAKAQALTGEHPFILAGNALILTKHIADFTTAYADIPSRDIRIRANYAVERGHKTLAKTHYFRIALPLRVKI